MQNDKKTRGPKMIFVAGGRSIEVNEWTVLDDLIKKSQDSTDRQVQLTSSNLGIGKEAAAMIVYLRGRSRWTQAKENKLVEIAHDDVLCKEFDWSSVLRGDETSEINKVLGALP